MTANEGQEGDYTPPQHRAAKRAWSTPTVIEGYLSDAEVSSPTVHQPADYVYSFTRYGS